MTLQRRLGCDERGAIMVLGVFMAIFLTAALYYLIGIGEAIWQRERMQDAADAAAFSAAVVHARGMNLIALINMVMAALLAVLVALKLIETLITVAIVAIGFASFLAPNLAEAIPLLEGARESTREAHALLQPEIDLALQTLHGAAIGVRMAVPAASELPVVAGVAEHYAPPAQVAFALPARATLPTEDGSFAELCDHAGHYVGDATRFAMAGLVPGPIAGLVGGAIEDLSKAGAAWFCGAEGVAPPTTTVHDTAHYPNLPAREQCMSASASGQDGADALANACRQAERDEAASEPDDLGRCTQRCRQGEPYAQRDALARQACAPRGKDDPLYDFDWQQRSFRRSYRFERGRWQVTSNPKSEEAHARYTRLQDDVRPCGFARAQVSPDWSLATRDADGRPVPLCSNARPPAGVAREGASVALDHTEVTHLFGCREGVTRSYDLGAHAKDRLTAEGAAGESSPGTRVPQDMVAGAELGEEAFQVRAAVLGSTPAGVPEAVVRVASWGKSDAGADFETARALGRVALAQAEYYYAVQDPAADERSSYLWNMRWRARLRRFRLPERDASSGEPAGAGGLLGALHGVCARAVGGNAGKETPSCGQLDLSIADLFVH